MDFIFVGSQKPSEDRLLEVNSHSCFGGLPGVSFELVNHIIQTEQEVFGVCFPEISCNVYSTQFGG